MNIEILINNFRRFNKSTYEISIVFMSQNLGKMLIIIRLESRPLDTGRNGPFRTGVDDDWEELF